MKRPPPTRQDPARTGRRAGRRAGAALGLALACGSARALSTPAELFGGGPRSVALAGAGVSLELGPESVIENPAMVAPGTKSLVAGLRASRFVLDVDGAGSPAFTSAGTSNGFYLGAVAPLSDGEFETAIGLFAGGAPDYIVRADLPLAEVPDFPLLVGRASAFDFGAALGLRHAFWSLGVGVRALAALSGEVGAVRREERVAQVVDNELVPAYAPSFGAGIDPGGGFAIGLTLRTVLRADFDVNLATRDLGGIPLAPMHIQGVAHYEPLRLDGEVSKRFGATTLLLAATYERWSDYPGALGPTVECPEEEEECRVFAPPSPRASDVVVPRLALTHELDIASLEVTLRGGYAFVPAALPEQRGQANDFDSTRHAFSFGYSLGLPREPLPLDLEAAFRLDVLETRAHRKAGLEPVETGGHVTTFVFGARLEL